MNEQLKIFSENLKNLVFSELDIQVPFDDIKKEFNNFSLNNSIELVSFQTHKKRPVAYNLDVLGLIDFDTDPRSSSMYTGKEHKDKFPDRKPRATDLYKFFPKTIDWIFKNIPGVVRCKISKLAAGKSVAWHRHPDHLIKLDGVLHIPIITNPKVKMLVRFLDGSNKEYAWHFEAGKLYWFLASENVEHSVINESEEDRWHLWINTHILDSQYRIVGQDPILVKSLHSSKNRIYHE